MAILQVFGVYCKVSINIQRINKPIHCQKPYKYGYTTSVLDQQAPSEYLLSGQMDRTPLQILLLA